MRKMAVVSSLSQLVMVHFVLAIGQGSRIRDRAKANGRFFSGRPARSPGFLNQAGVSFGACASHNEALKTAPGNNRQQQAAHKSMVGASHKVRSGQVPLWYRASSAQFANANNTA